MQECPHNGSWVKPCGAHFLSQSSGNPRKVRLTSPCMGTTVTGAQRLRNPDSCIKRKRWDLNPHQSDPKAHTLPTLPGCPHPYAGGFSASLLPGLWSLETKSLARGVDWRTGGPPATPPKPPEAPSYFGIDQTSSQVSSGRSWEPYTLGPMGRGTGQRSYLSLCFRG